MKKLFNNKIALVAAVILLLFVAVGSTLAYIFISTGSIENVFNPSKVSCAVVEGSNEPVTSGNVNTGNVKENVKIRNTGNTDAFIRVAVVFTWQNEAGEVHASKPIEGTDYTVEWNTTDWKMGADGFYYYNASVPPCTHTGAEAHAGCMTADLIESCTPVAGKAPTGYVLSVEIVASAIQSEGIAESAEAAWAKAVK